MANHLTHQIQAKETVQSIAAEKLGDVRLWPQLVSLNHLDFPYIVRTEHEKANGLEHRDSNGVLDQKHWLTYGDKIKLPTFNRTLPNTTHAPGSKHTYDTVMGMDLKLGFKDPSPAPGANFGDEAAYLQVDNKHQDLATVSGNRNLMQSIRMRLITQKNSLKYHPNYGSMLQNFIGKPITTTPANTCSDIRDEIVRTIRTDPRVSDCKVEECHLHNENFFAIAYVIPISPYRAFSMYVDSIHGNWINVGFNS